MSETPQTSEHFRRICGAYYWDEQVCANCGQYLWEHRKEDITKSNFIFSNLICPLPEERSNRPRRLLM